MRLIFPAIIFTFLTFIAPGILPAADIHFDLLAALKSGPPLSDIHHGDVLINEPEPLRGSFLVATRRLEGSFFSKTVILMLNHGDQGSSGLVINHPSHKKLSAVFPDVKELQNNTDKVYTGGPVELNNFLILIKSDGKPPKSQRFTGNFHMSASIETLKYMYKQSGTAESVRVFFGYAGWRPHQLINEVERGSWHVIKGDMELVFDNNSGGLWDKLIKRNSSMKNSAP